MPCPGFVTITIGRRGFCEDCFLTLYRLPCYAVSVKECAAGRTARQEVTGMNLWLSMGIVLLMVLAWVAGKPIRDKREPPSYMPHGGWCWC